MSFLPVVFPNLAEPQHVSKSFILKNDCRFHNMTASQIGFYSDYTEKNFVFLDSYYNTLGTSSPHIAVLYGLL